MAEALALIGLVSSIVQFVSFGTAVVTRLHEFQEKTSKVPKVFDDIRIRLPSLLNSLKRIEEQANAGGVDEDAREALQPVIEGCHAQVQQLDEILDKVLPSINDSSWRRGTKAVLSVSQESKVQRIGITLGENIQLLTLHQVSGLKPEATKVTQPLFLVPFERDSKFIGRKAIIDEISRKFKVQRQVAIAGLGGVGKSQIAIEYSYVHKEIQPDAHVFWTHCSSRERLEQAYREISRRLSLPGWDDPKADTLQLVFEWFNEEQNGHWLLIIDNADDAATFFVNNSDTLPTGSEQQKPLAKYLPYSSKGSILITTRDKRVGERLANREKSIEISPMAPSEAEALLRSKIPEEDWVDTEANELLKELAFLPLAITQAAAFISENDDTISEYLEALRGKDADFKELLSENQEDRRRDLYMENSVMRTWKMSFDQISKEKPRAAEILSLMAVLDRQGVPRMLVRKDSESEIGFKTALGTLQAFSLITVEKGRNAALAMHRLVQLSTQRWLDLRGDLSIWQAKALNILSMKFPEDAEYNNWAIIEALNPHAQKSLSLTYSTKASQLDYATLLGLVASYDFEKGKHSIAREKNLKALAIRENILADDHPLVLKSVNDLGEMLMELGEMEESRVMLQRAKLGRERVLGTDELETLESVNSLALLSLKRHDLDTAESLAQRALTGMRKLLGREHKDTRNSLHTLAMVRYHQGDINAAIELFREVLRNEEKVLGPEHPEVLLDLSNIGLALAKKGELDTAEEMLQRVLTTRRKVLGDDHPYTLSSINNLALILSQKGDLDRGEAMYQELLERQEGLLGVDHFSNLLVVANLGAVKLEQQHDIGAAEKLHRRALAGREKILGADHPVTILSLHQLALSLYYLDRYEESEKLSRRVVAGRTELFGKDHIDTLTSLRNMAITIEDQGSHRYKEVEMIYRSLIESSEKEPGEDFKAMAIHCLRRLQDVLELQKKREEVDEIANRIPSLQLHIDGKAEDTAIPSSDREVTTESYQSTNTQQTENTGDAPPPYSMEERSNIALPET